MGSIIFIVLGAVALLFVYAITRPQVPLVLNHWSLYFVDRQFSTKEFYANVERLLADRKVPDVKSTRVEFLERGFFSSKREYCRIKFTHYTFDICAAPYGTGYFTSWWFGEDVSVLTRMLHAIPLLGWYLKRKRARKTYHILDTESMFQAAVHQAVLDTIEQLSAGKAFRSLNDYERQPKRVMHQEGN